MNSIGSRVAPWTALACALRRIAVARFRRAGTRRMIRLDELSEHAQRDLGFLEGRISETRMQRMADSGDIPARHPRW